MQEKKAVTRQVRSRYQKAGRKEKSAVPDECISITGYKNRKYAMRVLNKQAPALLFTKGGAARLKPAKPKPANRKGKKIYADNAIAALRLVRAFFRYKCGKLLAPLMRRQTVYIALWPVFGITADIREKLTRISPAAIGRALKNDRAALALKGKSLTESAGLLKHRIPVRTFHASEERKLPGFIQIDTARHCGQAASGQYILTAADAASGRICLYSLLNKARCRTFDAPMDIHANLPFPLREFHSDNCSGFINRVVTGRHRNPACPVPFTRSRDRKKNGSVVRSIPAVTALRGMSSSTASPPLPGFFMPAMKLESKVKAGSKEVKKYDAPRSPYRRLLESDALPPRVRAELTRLCGLYNPVRLQRNVNKAVPALREAVAALSSSSGREPAA